MQWLVFLWDVTVQASTPVCALRRCGRLEPLEHLRQLSFEQLEFGDLLPDSLQLLRHEGMQPGTHGQTFPIVQLCRQRFERGKRKPERPYAANEQEPMDIVAEVLPVSRATPPWYGQHPDLLVIANGFCWDAGGMRELPDNQRSFHSRSSLCDVSGKKGTHSTRWKVKGRQGKNRRNDAYVWNTLPKSVSKKDPRSTPASWASAILNIFMKQHCADLFQSTHWSVNLYFAHALQRAGLPAVRLYDARHTYATWMLEQGVSPKVVQTMLGHGSIAVTLDIYSHVSLDLERQEAAKLNAALTGA